VDLGQQISIFPGKFPKNFDFFKQFNQKFDFARQKLAIYSYFWANYSISLPKSPLSNMLPVHQRYIITRPPCDNTTTLPKI